jgi:inorganic pyrophosphatase/exopolyphosphatase
MVHLPGKESGRKRNMPGPIYVVGHKHSDLDSVASAYGYARLLQLEADGHSVLVEGLVSRKKQVVARL